jgi:hypothetical protein
MSVSSELLCSFELLKPLDSSALKSHIKKGRNKRNSSLNSPVRLSVSFQCPTHGHTLTKRELTRNSPPASIRRVCRQQRLNRNTVMLFQHPNI